MVQFRLKLFSELIEKLFATTEDKLFSYSETSCREIIKCMEMWQESCLMHWINDVSLAQYGIVKRSNNPFASLFACCADTQKINNFGLKQSMINFLKNKNPEETVKRLKEEILSEKDNSGSLKYKTHLKSLKDFKFSDKFYVSFFTILCYLVNGQVGIEDILDCGFYIENSGKISGNLNSLIKSSNSSLDKIKIIRAIVLLSNIFQENESGSKEINKIIIDFYSDL